VVGDGPSWRKPAEASLAFSNRVVKNWKHLAKWARRENVHALRVYDADLPEYAVAVDLYEGVPGPGAALQRWAYVQEYAPPKEIEPAKAEKRLADVIARLPEALALEADRVVLRKRKRQRLGDQYEADADGHALIVEEAGHRFLVRLGDYVDTGLFLDQRTLRQKIGAASAGKNLLNLFSYTGSATVYAAQAGAGASTSVDLSKTYLAWAEHNFRLNGVDPARHRLVHDDCVRWLDVAAAGRERWDVIVLAPPTFSNSKRMEGVLDVQRDHGPMLEACARLLARGGEIYFVTHFRKFKLEAPSSLVAQALSVLPPDFARDARFHAAWKLTPRSP
jgi:23S rRNA (guanine2445-N2)-methyltransferase / 23S rRNA (guanine2069-N7)-methyltransferase